MRPIVIALPGNHEMGERIAAQLGAQIGDIEYRRFPDEECYLRLNSDVSGREVILVSTLDRPDSKLVPLMFLSATARELGAARVGLIAPYLAYMRQDDRFVSGEAVGARLFAQYISTIADWLITVDPHLHRISKLSEIYSIPTFAVQSSAMVADWIRHHIPSPLLIGPDSESTQWVSVVAKAAGAPFIVLAKQRHGDRNVEVSVPDVAKWKHHTPVIVDDIISTARTMIETAGHLRQTGMKPPHCVGIHAVFARDALETLRAAGADRIVTTNTIPHETNEIDLSTAIANAVPSMIG